MKIGSSSSRPLRGHVPMSRKKRLISSMEIKDQLETDSKVVANKEYYIPFSKETVDKIIANSPETFKPDIKYTVVFEGTLRDDRFSYEQFFKSWDELSKLSNRKGGPKFGEQFLCTEDVLKVGVG